jgi:hypothetical protein
MASLSLTPKTASYGILDSLPASDVSTNCPVINPSYYQAIVGTLSPDVVLGQYLIAKVTLQNAVGASVRTLRITKANGTDVLIQFDAASQPALPSGTTSIYSARVIIEDIADWVNVQLQVSTGAAGDNVVVKADSLVFCFAESCNITNEILIKRNIENIYFCSMQNDKEAILGKVGSTSVIGFTTLQVNGLVTGFGWSSNSGNTLYSWDGSSVGLK